jgi:CRISPR-associated exonuclease Cas4
MFSSVFLPIVVSLSMLLLAVFVLWRGRLAQDALGMPAGHVLASDTGRWRQADESLVARDLKLTGKPDYIVQERDGSLIPVEIKSTDAPDEPHDGHVLQLAAYCLLIWRSHGIRPEYGILHYADKSFEVDFTIDLEEDVLDLLADMREDLFAADVPREHEEWWRCRGCGVRSACDQALI